MSKVYKVKARIHREGVPDFWLRVGTATEIDDDKIILTLDALPLHSDGVMILYLKDKEEE